MGVTEIAILSILLPYTSTSPEFLTRIQASITTLNKASGGPFSVYTQIEDPSVFYFFGSWASTDAHTEFLISPENQELLKLVDGYVNVDAMFHIPVEKSSLPLSAPVLTIARHYTKEGMKEEFEKTLMEVKGGLEEFTKPYPLVGGWRIDGIEGDPPKEEWVQFTGFERVECHYVFAKTGGFKEYSRIKEFVREFDIKHAKVLELK